MHRPWRWAWAAPCTLLGLLLVAPAIVAGRASGRFVDGVIEVALHEASARTRRWLPFNAICFGHLIFGLSHAQLDHLRAHERVHVRQYERWGAAFLIAYPLASAWQWLRGRRAYHDNPFEVEARTVAQMRKGEA